MKIIVASHTYIVDLNREKLRELANLEPDVEVTVIVPRRWRPGGVQNKIIETEYLDEGSFKVVPVANFSENNQGLLTFGLDLIKVLQEFKPDIIQVEQGSKALTYAQFISLNKLLCLKAKNVFFTWWNLPYDLQFPVSLLEDYNLKNTDGIVAGNKDGEDILRQRGYAGPIKVLPQLGVDETLFKPESQPELQQKLGISADDFVVGFVGRFVDEKGILTLNQALGGLSDVASATLRERSQPQIKTMTATKTEYKYIHLDEKNVPIITGSTMKVVELITSVKAYGWTPEELHESYPHLSMSQIHSALAYYWDNREEIDADYEKREEYVKQAEREAGMSPIAVKIRKMGLK